MAESNFGTLIETTVRVATWNLWWQFGPWEERLPAVIETLLALDADVICLQEVWLELDTGRSSAGLIADALGAHVVTANRADLDGLGFANAVVSRWPIASHDWRPLYSPPDLEEYRLVLRADVDGPRGPLQVFTTHLHWRLDHSHIRQQQVREICEFVATSPDRTYPPILCGDFNADPEAEEIRMLTGLTSVPSPPLVFHDAWRFAGKGDGMTWSNANPYEAWDLEAERRLDYVFVGWPKQGGAGHIVGVDLIGTEPVGGVWPSDHYGVCATLRY